MFAVHFGIFRMCEIEDRLAEQFLLRCVQQFAQIGIRAQQSSFVVDLNDPNPGLFIGRSEPVLVVYHRRGRLLEAAVAPTT